MNARTIQRQLLHDVSRRAAALEGERSALEARRKAIAAEVGLAKGRLAQKARVDSFLEELQAEAHARRVGDFEKLLTALVSEVLPKEAPIGLELEIERGQPSLDIVSRHSADANEDIYDDQGGALTNVVSMGLRMISVVRSGMQRFLMLDESDCWISNKRVPAFYSVLKEAARKVDVQCLAVSHHDIGSFSDGIATAKLSGHPEASGGVRIENSPRPYRWADDENGIRWIRLRNFQGYIDETLHLTPGVNALTGENNVGKSSFVRAFRAVFYGEARDSLIRRGERKCAVEIGFPGGRVLHWDRQARRNPVNLWKLLGPDGAVVSENGMTYETGGRTVPEWVASLFRIGPVEGLDVHAVKQKSPVFLLDKPGSTRAAVLSVGMESGYIRKMVALHREACARDAACVKEGEAEMSSVLARLEAMEKLSLINSSIAGASALLDSITGREAEAASAMEAVSRLEEALASARSAGKRKAALAPLVSETQYRAMSEAAAAAAAMAAAADRLASAYASHVGGSRATAVLAALPEAPPSLAGEEAMSLALEGILASARAIETGRKVSAVLAALPPALCSIDRNDERIRAGRTLKEARAADAAADARRKAFSALPEGMPGLSAPVQQEEAISRLSETAVRLADARRAASSAEAGLAACEKELSDAVEEMGAACPLCGHEVDGVHAFLRGHHHREAAHA